jgi:hypothetical protein
VQDSVNAVVRATVSRHRDALPVHVASPAHEVQKQLGVGGSIARHRDSGIVADVFGQTNDAPVQYPAQRTVP